jgi:hypothetical protein
VNETATHEAFVAEYCTEHVTRSLTKSNLGVVRGVSTGTEAEAGGGGGGGGGADLASRWILDSLHFFGLTEYFDESVCLFLYQAGRFRRDLCTCAAADAAVSGPLAIGQEVPPPDSNEAALQRWYGAGVPPLRLSDAQLRRRSPRDLSLYATLLRAFRERVRALEQRVNASVWQCGKMSPEALLTA